MNRPTYCTVSSMHGTQHLRQTEYTSQIAYQFDGNGEEARGGCYRKTHYRLYCSMINLVFDAQLITALSKNPCSIIYIILRVGWCGTPTWPTHRTQLGPNSLMTRPELVKVRMRCTAPSLCIPTLDERSRLFSRSMEYPLCLSVRVVHSSTLGTDSPLPKALLMWN